MFVPNGGGSLCQSFIKLSQRSRFRWPSSPDNLSEGLPSAGSTGTAPKLSPQDQDLA